MTGQKKERQQERADRLVEATRDGYSFTRYGQAEWKKGILILIRLGMTDREITAIMLSKWTRWAADSAGRNEDAKGVDIRAFIQDAKNFRGAFRDHLASLVREHYAGEQQ